MSDVFIKTCGKINASSKRIRSILYIPVHNLIVTGDYEHTVKIFDYESRALLHTISSHNSDINHLIQWDENSILTTSYDRIINHYSLKPPDYKLLRRFDIHGKGLIYLVKIPENQVDKNGYDLLTFDWGNNLRLVMTDKKIVKFLQTQKVINNEWKKLILSKKNEETIFMNTDDKQSDGNLKHINYVTNKVINYFGEHKQLLYTCDSFVNRQGIEVVLGGGDHVFVAYNSEIPYAPSSSSSSSFSKKPKIPKLIKKITFRGKIYSLCVVKNKYILVGTGGGILHILDSTKEYELVYEVRIHKRTIYDIKIVKFIASGVEIITSDENGEVVISRIQGLVFLSEALEKQDLIDRILFVWEEKEQYSIPQMEFEIKFKKNEESFNVCKSFLLL